MSQLADISIEEEYRRFFLIVAKMVGKEGGDPKEVLRALVEYLAV